MDFVYELLLSLCMFVIYVKPKVNIQKIFIIIIYIIFYDIYSILMCQYHPYLVTLLKNFRLHINIHNKYYLMIISFMECLISYKDEYYQNAGRTCKICKLKRYYFIAIPMRMRVTYSTKTLLFFIYLVIYSMHAAITMSK